MADITAAKIEGLKQRLAGLIEQANPEYLIGADEVGFGPIAGPIVIGVVSVPIGWVGPKGLTDSKALSSKQIDVLAKAFFATVGTDIQGTIALSHADRIDQDGLGKMRRECFIEGIQAARAKLPPGARSLAIVDGNLNLPDSVSIPKADLICPVVSMAAVVAKHIRDHWMREVADVDYPGYGFASHVGYDVPAHRSALRRLGPCPIHRMSTKTLKDIVRSGVGAVHAEAVLEVGGREDPTSP